jgi:hypothetical protein
MRTNPALEESKNNTQDQGRSEKIEPPESPINLRKIRVLKITKWKITHRAID